MRFSSWIGAGGWGGENDRRRGPREEEREMKGREEGAGRAAMPPWLWQGDDVFSTTEPCVKRWGCFTRSPHQPAKGQGGRLQLP